jgi:ribonuclease HI
MLKALLRMSFYAVAKGRNVGVFNTWAECERNVKQFKDAKYKKFKTLNEASEFVKTFSTGTCVESKKTATIGGDGIEEPPKKKHKKLTDEEEINEILSLNFDDSDIPTKNKTLKTTTSSSSFSKPDKIQFALPKATTLKKYSNYNFREDDDGFVHAYTDGSCENNGKRNAIAGLGVYFDDNHPLNVSEKVLGRHTNNIGEIRAAIRAIEVTNKCGIKKLKIFTDSQFLINSICKWIKSWKARNWILASGKPVANKEDFSQLDALINSCDMKIHWNYIPAHKGHHGNEEADRLAKEGAHKM